MCTLVMASDNISAVPIAFAAICTVSIEFAAICAVFTTFAPSSSSSVTFCLFVKGLYEYTPAVFVISPIILSCNLLYGSSCLNAVAPL